MKALNLVTLLLIIIGGINWLLVGAFQFDLVAAIFGGQDAALARIVYVLLYAAGVRGVRTLAWVISIVGLVLMLIRLMI